MCEISRVPSSTCVCEKFLSGLIWACCYISVLTGNKCNLFLFFSSCVFILSFSRAWNQRIQNVPLDFYYSFPLFFIKLEQKQNISTFATLFYTIRLLHRSTLKLGFDDACTFMNKLRNENKLKSWIPQHSATTTYSIIKATCILCPAKRRKSDVGWILKHFLSLS